MHHSRRLALADYASLSRVLLAGAFVVTSGMLARLALVAIAGVSDYADGWLARHAGKSRYGAIIDPAADRVFVVIVVATLVVENVMTLTQCLVLMARDIVTTIGAVVVRLVPALRGLTLAARSSGKVVTALQFVAVIGVIIDRNTLSWLLPLVAIASAIAIGDYTLAVWRRRAVA